jgi:hypothetical protein
MFILNSNTTKVVLGTNNSPSSQGQRAETPLSAAYVVSYLACIIRITRWHNIFHPPKSRFIKLKGNKTKLQRKKIFIGHIIMLPI